MCLSKAKGTNLTNRREVTAEGLGVTSLAGIALSESYKELAEARRWPECRSSEDNGQRER